MAGQDWFEKDFYAVLGVPQDADASAVKKAYRKLARTHHPDANAGDAASERRFKEVGEAYAVLSDPEQRQQYDAIRQMSRGGARFTAGGPGGGAGFEDVFGNLFGQGGQGGRGGFGPGGGNVRFGTGGTGGAGGPSLEDLLGGVFGQQAPPGRGYRSPRGPRRGEDLASDARLTFRQALDGSMLSLRVDEGRAGTRTVTARIPAGVRDGQKVRLRGKGLPGEPGADPGDLVVTVHVEPHPVFTIDGSDVRVTLPVTFAEAALGAEVEAPTPGGGTVRLKLAPGTPSGRTLRVKGRGVKSPRRTGDLLVTVQVVVPQRVDGAAREALEAFAAATKDHDPRGELLEQVRRESGAGDGR